MVIFEEEYLPGKRFVGMFWGVISKYLTLIEKTRVSVLHHPVLPTPVSSLQLKFISILLFISEE